MIDVLNRFDLIH